jgi:transcriptional regulator with XRE-family HTH domain
MTSVNKLLDISRKACSLRSDSELAASVGVSRQLVSQWRNGSNPMSDERVAQLAEMAKIKPDSWLLAVRAEQAHGAAAKHWRSLVQRLGSAAAITLAVLPLAYSSAAQALVGHAESSPLYALCEVVMRCITRFARKCVAVFSGSGQYAAASPLLA